MPKRKTKKKNAEKKIIEAELNIHSDMTSSTPEFMCIEQAGYKAVFHKKEHIKMVEYLLSELEGCRGMICTLEKAINLIDK